MRTVLAYTPPDLQEARSGTVRRRQVFFLPGYDPEGRSRYRMLFVRELSRAARRFGEGRRTISPAAMSADGLRQSWSVAAHPETDGAQVDYHVLLWDDIVTRDFRRPRVLSVLLLVAGTLQALALGMLWRFYRWNWRYGNVTVYPFAMVALLTLVSLALGALVHALLGEGFGLSLGLPLWISLPFGLAAGIGWIVAIEAFLNRIFFWQLLNDWVFNWQYGGDRRPDYRARVEALADSALGVLAAAEAAGDRPDEVMIVGHSTGAMTALEIAARLLARDPGLGAGETALSLATIGSGLPLVAAHPGAGRLRGEIAAVIGSRRIVWCDFQAPQDWMNFPGFNPVRDLPLDLDGRPVANPIVRSARFRDILTPETYAKVVNQPFRMHFQFLIANERAGEYDYFRMVLGPQRLRDRAVRPIIGPAPVVPPAQAGA